MSERLKTLNAPVPQTITSAAVSAAIGCSDVMLHQITAAGFYCVSAVGTGVDGNAVGATNGHYIGAGEVVVLRGLNHNHKIGVSAGTMYISAIG